MKIQPRNNFKSAFIARGLIVILLAGIFSPSSLWALTKNDIIDNTLRIDSTAGADDVLARLQQLIQKLVDDPADDAMASASPYGQAGLGMGFNFTQSSARVSHFRGTTVSILSTCLPLLPGTIGDTATLKGKLAARLKTEVTTYLLNSAYWDWEYSAASGGTYVRPDNPRIPISWNHKTKSGPHWEKLYALWAYAYYTGDWTTIQNNWSFIKARYAEGYTGTDNDQRSCITSNAVPVFRSAVNDLTNGLIGYTRMAQHLNDPTASTARTQAGNALDAVLTRVNVAWNQQDIYAGWDGVVQTVASEWTPGYNLTPELGRWINDQSLATAQTRLNAATNDPALINHWSCGFMNNYWKNSYPYAGEDALGTESLSHELFMGRAWMLMESGVVLRPVLPWPTVMGRTPEFRDYPFIRDLYALIARLGSASWLTVN